LGLSDFSTPVQVWLEIEEELHPGFAAAHGYALPDPPDNPAITYGLLFENAIAETVERITGKQIKEREKEFSMDLAGHGKILVCHADGVFEDGTLYEAKTSTSFMWREKWGSENTDRIPGYYQCQCQNNLMVAGAEKLTLALLCFPESPETFERLGWTADLEKMRLFRGGKEVDPVVWAEVLNDMGYLKFYSVEARPSLQAAMIERYKEFWEKHVVPGAPPEPENYDDIKRLFPEPKKTLIVSADVGRMLSEYAQINEETKEQEKRREEIKLKVLAWAREQTDGVIDDDSTEALILRDGKGDKVGSFAKNKNGTLVFRA
jgi:predicted phage-related endonuclease